MNMLLDTHVLIWTFTNDVRIGEKGRNLIGSSQNEIFFSLASVWEVAIKHTVRPDSMPVSDNEFLDYCVQSGFKELPIMASHILALKTLRRQENTPIHKDPFDRILIAQAKTEGMHFLTHDKLLSFYVEPCVVMI